MAAHLVYVKGDYFLPEFLGGSLEIERVRRNQERPSAPGLHNLGLPRWKDCLQPLESIFYYKKNGQKTDLDPDL